MAVQFDGKKKFGLLYHDSLVDTSEAYRLVHNAYKITLKGDSIRILNRAITCGLFW